MTDIELRRRIYTILILISAGLIFGRILAVDSIPDRTIQEYRLAQIPKRLQEKAAELRKEGLSEEQIKARLKVTAAKLRADAIKVRPTLSANDRSRWLTIRALVEPESRVYRYLPADADGNLKESYSSSEILRNSTPGSPDSFEKKNLKAGSYVKELVPYAIDKAMETPGWETIDMVKHGGTREVFDPSDPFSGYLYSSKPPLLPTLMAVPYWVLYKTTGLTLRENPFLVTRILLVVYNLIPLVIGWFLLCGLIERFGGTGPLSDWSKIFAAGTLCFGTFLSTFAVTLNNHIPGAVSIMISLYAVVRILVDQDPKKRYFFTAALFGALAVACELPAVLIAFLLCALLLIRFPKKTILVSVPAGLAVAAAFFAANIIAHGTVRPAYSQKRDHIALAKLENPENAANSFSVSSFDKNDWYIYRYFPSGAKRDLKYARMSYWSDRQGVDRGEESHWRYAFHALIGHHGLFSLTPVWLLSAAGLFILLKRKREGVDGPNLRFAAGMVICIALFFFCFYLSRDQGDRNYGGMTCGLRWFFPLIPFWILSMLPTLNRIGGTRIGRMTALLLLFISALSAAYPLWNPWSHPWILNMMLGR